MDVSKLCAELEADPLGSANNVAMLVAGVPEMQGESLVLALGRLVKFFTVEGKPDLIQTAEGESSHREIYQKWFSDTVKICKQHLIERLTSESIASVQVAVFEALMRLVGSQKEGEFDNELFAKVLEVLLQYSHSGTILETLCETYLRFADVRYFALKVLAKECDKLRDGTIETGTGACSVHHIKRLLFALPKCMDRCRDSEGTLMSLCAASEVVVSSNLFNV